MTGPDGLPGRLVLLGHPVAHSLSPRFQDAALAHAGLPLRYEALDVSPAMLDEVLDALVRERAAGNVTIPHKEAVHARCASVDAVARRVGAVNTFKTADGALLGCNTDVAGIAATLAALEPDGLADARCAVLGAGGSAAAVLVALGQSGCRDIALWSRTPMRGAALADRVGVDVRLADSAVDAVVEASVVINATPIGMADDAMPVAPAALGAECRVFDLVYRRGGTPWVNACLARGLRAEDGLRMLVEQGAVAFAWWFGVDPDRDAMWRALDAAPMRWR
jgi:shikimate dehydrogenase